MRALTVSTGDDDAFNPDGLASGKGGGVPGAETIGEPDEALPAEERIGDEKEDEKGEPAELPNCDDDSELGIALATGMFGADEDNGLLGVSISEELGE